MTDAIPEKVRLFRLVHIDNLDHILNHGIYVPGHPLCNPDYVNIGDLRLIDQRSAFRIPVEGKGTLGEYVPFYFCGHTPMLLNIRTGHRGITMRAQDDLAFVMSSVDTLLKHGIELLFTDGHAKNRLTQFFTDAVSLSRLDWQAIQSQIWRATEGDEDKARRKQSEMLVRQHVPLACIDGIIVYSESAQVRLEKTILSKGLNLRVHVDKHRKYFYP